MCGIFGIINKDGSEVNEILLKTCSEVLNHRGPDGHGYYIKDNIGFGHHRLSIIDTTENGGQPMHKHDLVIIYNGELYNYKALREELITLNYEFFSNSDTEVVLSAFHCWGNDALQKFNGMWSFVILQKDKNQLFYSRDRYGMKPLYIYESTKYLSFASEIKAFSKLPDWGGNLHKKIVKDFLVEGKLHHKQESFYENVLMVSPASYGRLTMFGKALETEKYYKIPEPISGIKIKDSIEKYKMLFSNAVQNHFVSDVPVACALSGGLDSSSIVCESLGSQNELTTFTYSPCEEKYSEYGFAQEVIQKHNLKNHKISPNFEEHESAHLNALNAGDAPALSMNLISAYLLYKKVGEEDFKVLLAGQGADELLLGYNFYHSIFLKHLLREKSYGRFIIEIVSLINKYPKSIMRTIAKPFQNSDYSKFFEFHQAEKFKRDRTQTFSADYEYFLSDGHLHALLQFEDRMGMAHGVEGRLPFLDKEFSQFLHTIPPEQKIKHGVKKSILREAMAKLVPTSILKRKDKLGFLSPQDLWLYDNQNYILEGIKAGMHKHPNWVNNNFIHFAERSLHKRNTMDFPIVWRVYSFFRFLEVKL